MKKKIFLIILVSILLVLSLNANFTNAAGKTTKQKVAVSKKVKAPVKVTWTAAALKELRRVPLFARATVKAKINAYAVKHRIKVITQKIYKSIHV